MNIFTKTAALGVLAAPLLMTNPAMASGCGPGEHGYCCDDPTPPTIEQVLVHEAHRGLRKLDRYLEHRYGDDTPIGPMRRGKRR